MILRRHRTAADVPGVRRGQAGAVFERLRYLSGLATIEHPDPRAEVLVVTSGWPGAASPTHCVFIKRQMDSLADLGIRYEALVIHGYRSPLAYLVAAARLIALNLRRPRYRLVHAHGGEAALVAGLFRRVPRLFSYLGGDLLGNSFRPDAVVSRAQRVRRGIIRQGSRLATETITKSQEMEGALPRSVRSRNTVVPNGVDIDHFRPMDRSAARAELGWDEQARVALFVGNPDELRKRHGLAVAAVERARQTLPDLRLTAAHRVDPQLTPAYMNAADCLLHLSWMEGSPNVVKEALMCNLPILATAVGDIPQLLQDVSPSFLVEPDESAVADALLRCLRTPERSDGRIRSVDRLSASKVAARVAAIYDRLDGTNRDVATACAGG